MSFDGIDRLALERARECGFVHEILHVPHGKMTEVVYKINFGPQISSDFVAKEIAAALEAFQRLSGSHITTFWIDITTDIVHVSLIEGIEKCAYFQPNLFVSFKDQASHAPAPQLPERLQDAVQKAASDRRMWHPILNTSVSANPARSRQ